MPWRSELEVSDEAYNDTYDPQPSFEDEGTLASMESNDWVRWKAELFAEVRANFERMTEELSKKMDEMKIKNSTSVIISESASEPTQQTEVVSKSISFIPPVLNDAPENDNHSSELSTNAAVEQSVEPFIVYLPTVDIKFAKDNSENDCQPIAPSNIFQSIEARLFSCNFSNAHSEQELSEYEHELASIIAETS